MTQHLTTPPRFLAALLLGCALSTSAHAQGPVPMADAMRADGKIYVVVAVVLVILLVLLGYLVWVDTRLKKMEEQLNQNNKP